MAEVNPPLVLEGGSHDSDLLRQLWGDTYTEGVVGAGHLEVTEQSTPALGVTVAAGRAFVDGSEAASQGVYYVRNDAAADVDLATADATNARIDLIVARVKDSFYSGGDDEWALEAVTGTPAGSPSAPAAPANSLVLAEVTVPADAGGNPAITNSDITDERTEAQIREELTPPIPAEAVVDGLNETSDPAFTASTFGILSNRGFSRTVSVTVETGTSVIVVVSCNFINSNGSGNTNLGYRVTGASSVVADFAKSILTANTAAATATFVGFQSGLTPGSNTFELQARTAATSGVIRHPSITVIPL